MSLAANRNHVSSPKQLSDFYRRGSAFGPKAEFLCLLSGLIFSAGALIEFFFLGKPPISHFGFIETFVLNIVLLNYPHNAFTFILPLVCPDVRNWFASAKIGHWRLIVLGPVVGLSVFGYLLVTRLLIAGDLRDYAALAFTLFVTAWSTHHVLSQTYGISRFYDSTSAPARLTFQRYAHVGMTVLITVKGLFYYLPLSTPFKVQALATLTLLVFLLALAIVTSALLEKDGFRSNKFLFLATRLPLYAFTFNGYRWPLYGFIALHGLEYLFVANQMVSKSEAIHARSPKYIRNWIYAGLIFSAVTLLALTRTIVWGGWFRTLLTSHTQVVDVLACVSLSIAMVHYFFDGHLFRMSNVRTRASVGHLVTNPTTDMRKVS